MDSLAFLERAAKAKLQPVYVVQGDEDFLKRQVLLALRTVVFGSPEEEFGLSTQSGDKATFAAVRNELETVPFLCPRRLVVVENADPFITKFRPALEKYVAEPAATGVLVLEAKSVAANTRLAKLLANDANIICKAPATYKMPEWCVKWAAARHGKQLNPPAARLLVDLIGPEMGLLDQELTKLAIYVGAAAKIDTADVDQLVGNSRSENTFKIFDAIAAGNAAQALTLLDRLFEQGEDPHRILGAFSLQLRRLAQAARLAGQGKSLATALEMVDVPPFARAGCEQQLRHIGRRRAKRLYDWLLEVDLGLKGGSQLSPRALIERFVIRLAREET